MIQRNNSLFWNYRLKIWFPQITNTILREKWWDIGVCRRERKGLTMLHRSQLTQVCPSWPVNHQRKRRFGSLLWPTEVRTSPLLFITAVLTKIVIHFKQTTSESGKIRMQQLCFQAHEAREKGKCNLANYSEWTIMRKLLKNWDLEWIGKIIEPDRNKSKYVTRWANSNITNEPYRF